MLLQDAEAMELLADAATLLARAHVPPEIQTVLAMARLTALRKPDGGVRGIATGDAFRRLVSRTLAKQWATVFDEATRPYQFALQARAGTDALAAHVRVALAQRSDAVLVSLDGRSAYDSMSRAAFLSKLREVAPELLPFTRMFYGRPSAYSWWDDAGRHREVRQGEGCEQGDPLAPVLYALGQHDALQRAASGLHAGDTLMAFLDDLFVTAPSRARTALDAATQAVADHCGIGSNLGKTRAMAAKEGPPPPGIAELGDDVWRGDKPSAQRGIVVPDRSTPTPPKPGQTRGCRRNAVCLTSCLTSQTSFQCAWLLLLFCASPRANHALRTLPPSESSYARAHDQAVWETLQECLGGVPPAEAQQVWPLASLPAVHGGLGLQSAERTAPAAYWAASSGLACPAQLIVAWRLWSKAQRARSLVCAKQRRRKTFYKEKAGKRAPAGTLLTKAPGRHNTAMQARANGLTAGSFTRRGLATSLSRPRAAAGSAAILSGLATLARRCMAVSSAERTSTHPRPAGHAAALVPRYEVRPCMLALYFLGETSKVFRLVKTSKVFARKHRRCFR